MYDILDRKSHINYVSEKLSRDIDILNKVKFKLNMKYLVLVIKISILILFIAVIFGVIHFFQI